MSTLALLSSTFVLIAKYVAAQSNPPDVSQLDLAVIAAAGPPPTFPGSTALGGTWIGPRVDPNAGNSKRRSVVLERNVECTPYLDNNPTVQGPSVDTPDAFTSYQPFSDAANAAVTPSGYVETFTDLLAENLALGFMGSSVLSDYDPSLCSALCDAHVQCAAFNIAFERVPLLNPGPDCANPNSTAWVKCTLWGGPVNTGNAINTGQWRNNFEVVVAGSNGYVNLTIDDCPGYDGPNYLSQAAIDAPLDCNNQSTYVGNAYWNDGAPFDSNRCAAVCNSYSNCTFFNTYVINMNWQPQGQYCAMYSQSWEGSYATNTGGPFQGNDYTITYSYSFSNSANPGVCSSGNTTLLGCYHDQGSPRALANRVNGNDPMTVEECSNLCSGYTYFGIEYGGECYCDNSMALAIQYGKSDNCIMGCNGNSAQACGGGWALDIYSQGVAAPTSTAVVISTSSTLSLLATTTLTSSSESLSTSTAITSTSSDSSTSISISSTSSDSSTSTSITSTSSDSSTSTDVSSTSSDLPTSTTDSLTASVSSTSLSDDTTTTTSAEISTTSTASSDSTSITSTSVSSDSSSTSSADVSTTSADDISTTSSLSTTSDTSTTSSSILTTSSDISTSSPSSTVSSDISTTSTSDSVSSTDVSTSSSTTLTVSADTSTSSSSIKTKSSKSLPITPTSTWSTSISISVKSKSKSTKSKPHQTKTGATPFPTPSSQTTVAKPTTPGVTPTATKSCIPWYVPEGSYYGVPSVGVSKQKVKRSNNLIPFKANKADVFNHPRRVDYPYPVIGNMDWEESFLQNRNANCPQLCTTPIYYPYYPSYSPIPAPSSTYSPPTSTYVAPPVYYTPRSHHCDYPGVCGTYQQCNPAADCYCGFDPDNRSICFQDESCAFAPSCSSNSDCGSGYACLVQSCCINPVCAAVSVCGNPNTLNKPRAIYKRSDPEVWSMTAPPQSVIDANGNGTIPSNKRI